MMIMITALAFGWETTLTNDAVLLVPDTRLQATVARTNGMTVTAGEARIVNGIGCVAQVGGICDTQTQTNTVTNAVTTKIIVSGASVPDVTGTYLYKGAVNFNPVYTQGIYAISYNQGKFRISANSAIGKSPTNCFIASTAIGAWDTNAVGIWTGSVTSAYDTAIVDTVTDKAPSIAATGATTDGTVQWLRLQGQRKAVVLDALEGDAVFSDANGNKLYGDAKLEGFDGAIYGASTNNAKVEVFTW